MDHQLLSQGAWVTKNNFKTALLSVFRKKKETFKLPLRKQNVIQ